MRPWPPRRVPYDDRPARPARRAEMLAATVALLLLLLAVAVFVAGAVS